jgi:hypothetical protein
MAIRRVQFNDGPAYVDIINFVPGDDWRAQITIDHDISAATFDAAIETSRGVLIHPFTVSGIAPLTSGILSLSMSAEFTDDVTSNSEWHFAETNSGVRKTLIAGNVELYTK